MADNEIYLLDTNIFIQAKKQYYAFDLAPAFWENLLKFSQIGRLYSIDKIKEELLRGKDDLSQWVKEEFANGFRSTDDDDVIGCYREVIEWVYRQPQYSANAKAVFSEVADGWLIAVAKAENHTIVTHETFDPNIKTKVKIPNVCRGFDIKLIDTFEMLRRLKVKFT